MEKKHTVTKLPKLGFGSKRTLVQFGLKTYNPKNRFYISIENPNVGTLKLKIFEYCEY